MMAATEMTLEKTIPQPMRTFGDENVSMEQSRRIRLTICLSLVLIVTAKLFFYASELLRDPDNWWQVKVGLDMLASRTIPAVDTYSHTFAGQPWIAKEWLGQVLLATGYKSFGWSGVIFLTVSAVGLMTFILAWCLSAVLKPIVTIVVVMVITFFVSAVYNARPLIFSLPIMVLWTAMLFQAARDRQAPPFWLLGLIALWANLHGTFTFGFVIAAFAGLDFLARVRLSQPRLLAKWIAFGLLCPLVTLINPYGVKAILATFTVASGNEAVARISEWNPFNARTDGFSEVLLLTVVAALLVTRIRIRWTYAAFFIFTLHLFLAYSRFQYIWLLLVPIVLAADVAEQFPALSTRRWLGETRDTLERAVVKHFYRISCMMVAGWLAGAAIFLNYSTVSPSDRTSASNALAFAQTHSLSGNVLNAYNFGGTLIFHDIKTYIDGRTDQLFLNGFMNATFEMGTAAGKPILQKTIEDHNIKWALLEPDDKRIPFFNELSGWRKAYDDKFAVVYVNDN
jgi:hypothetical protein